jgi:hypothetical protein
MEKQHESQQKPFHRSSCEGKNRKSMEKAQEKEVIFFD